MTPLPLLTVAVIASAPHPPARYVEPLGSGIERCREWLAQPSKDEWIAGYLTGFNTFGHAPMRRMTFFRFDLARVSAAVSASCRRKPDQTVFDAATQFVEEVQKHARPSGRK